MSRRRSILAYYAFRATRSYGFYLPYSVIFLERQGLGLAAIGIVQAAFLVAVVGGEIPTGYVADRFGRRASFGLASVLAAVSLALFPFATGTAAFGLLLGGMGLALTLETGASDAWLYELLEANGDDEEYARFKGRSETVRLVAGAGGAVLAGPLYALDPTYPFLANAGLAVLGLPVLLLLPTVPGGDGTTVADAVGRLRVAAGRPSLRWIAVYGALLFGLIQGVRAFEQLAAEQVGVPLVSLGVLYAAFKLSSAAAASTTGPLVERFGPVGALGLFAPVIVVAYGSVAFAPILVLPVLFANRGLMVALSPLQGQYVNDRLPDAGRATVVSSISMVASVGGALGTVLAGQVATVTGPVGLVPVAGVTVGLAVGGLWIATLRPYRRASTDESVGEDAI